MGTGWRRAFCTSILRDSDTTTTPTAAASSQSSCVKLGSIFSSSNPSTPRLRPADPSDSTPTAIDGGPKLQCKTTIPHPTSTTPATTATAAPNCSSSKPSPRNSSSPRSSPSRLALLKTALRLSRNRCGICGESVSQRTVGAVFTAECSHAFHFPCISTHVRSQGSLVCPVCSAAWREVPLLSSSLSGHRPRHHHLSDKSGNRELKTTPVTAKIYDDDESLQLSPTCGQVTGGGGGMLFNPIPEEELDEDDGECSIRGRGLPTTAAAVSFVPENLALVSTGRNHLSYVLSIKMKASQQPQLASVPSGLLDHPSCRAPIDLVTVLDVSFSMTVAKLQMLKRAMRLVISSLGPGDRLSIVAFSVAAAKRLLPLQRMSRAGQRSARQIVDRLVICGSNHAQEGGGGEGDDNCSSHATTCVGDALRKATKILEDRRERNPVATIMLLSDGHRQGNGHEHQQNEQHQQPSSGTRFAHIEIPINSSSGGFRNRVQKQGMPIAEEEENSFARSVNGLVSVVLQDVCLQLTFPSTGGGVVSSVYSYNECDEDVGIGQAISHGEGGKNVCVGDLYAGEERRLLVELKVPKTFVLGAAKHALSMSLTCTYRDPITRDVIRSGDQPIILPMAPHNNSFPILLRSSSSSSSSVSSPRVTSQQQQQELRNLYVTTRALAESRRLVELNDLETALHLVTSARALLLQQSKSSPVSASHRRLVLGLDGQLEELQRYQKQQRRRQQQQQQRSHSLSPRIRSCEQALLAEVRGGGVEPLTPTSAWRAAEQLAKVAIMRKSLNRVSDMHGFENARF